MLLEVISSWMLLNIIVYAIAYLYSSLLLDNAISNLIGIEKMKSTKFWCSYSI
jgi:hypothetical protein